MMTATQTRLEHILLDPDGPKVVALGGGHGLAVTLEAVQMYASEITAVVAVADDGGSSGRLTSGLGVPPPGDIRRCLLALTPEPTVWSELFAYRFAGGDIEDHSLGNLLLAALTDMTGDFHSGVQLAGRMLGAIGQVVPAANHAAVLRATVGTKQVEGQARISKERGGISHFEVGPEGLEAHPEALRAIAEADQIVIGPGSLYTSILAVLLVPGIAQAVMMSRGARVFVLNLICQDGETLGMTGAEHMDALATWGGVRGPGQVIANITTEDSPSWVQVGLADSDPRVWDWEPIEADVIEEHAEWPAHDPLKLGRVLADGLRGT